MPINTELWKARIAAGYRRLFGGRVARATFVCRAYVNVRQTRSERVFRYATRSGSFQCEQ